MFLVLYYISKVMYVVLIKISKSLFSIATLSVLVKMRSLLICFSFSMLYQAANHQILLYLYLLK